MLFQYSKTSKTNKTVEMLNDLMSIHNDRINAYSSLLSKLSGDDIYLMPVFEKIISDAVFYKQQIALKIKSISGDAKQIVPFGKIYAAWNTLKMAFKGNTSKSILAACHYNEEIAIHTYDVALSCNSDLSFDLQTLLQEQEAALSATCKELTRCIEACNVNVAGHKTVYHYTYPMAS